MEVLVLASGSSGNSALITSGGTSVLVDAGIAWSSLRRRLHAFGRSLDEVAAVLLTHEHTDHVRGLELLLRHHDMPVWATAGTWQRLDVRSARGGELRSGQELKVGGLSVLPVATSHDAREPVALVLEGDGHRLGFCTDTGVVTTLLQQRLQACELLLLETNHDIDLLRHGPYPWPLKQRIRSNHGHLANHQSEEAMASLRSLWLKAVVGLHVSEQNNRSDLALESLRRAVGPSLPVEVVTRHEMLGLRAATDGISLERRAVPAGRTTQRSLPLEER